MMTTLSELVNEGKERRITFYNKKDGRKLLELSLLWTVIIALAAPQAALLVLLLVLLDVLDVRMDDRQIDLVQGKKS
ncbi:MAG: DUF4342 domain-containing protein [Anaerolineales bacterium]|nr:DUF4342 domain-containing protein [Anaerolineales bacterium]MCB8951193.1 DUF4342 domain-containing protein [Ardenticatenales bacterium]